MLALGAVVRHRVPLAPQGHKARKVYFIDPLLLDLSLSWKEGGSDFYARARKRRENPQFLGTLLEQVCVTLTGRTTPGLYFWYSPRTKQEVDLLVQTPKGFDLYDCKGTGAGSIKALGRSITPITRDTLLEHLRRHGG